MGQSESVEKEHIHLLVLSQIKGLGRQFLKELLTEKRDCLEDVLRSPREILSQHKHIREDMARQIEEQRLFERAAHVYQQCQQQDIQVISFFDEHYPDFFRHLEGTIYGSDQPGKSSVPAPRGSAAAEPRGADNELFHPPLLLFARGDVSLLTKTSIALVGTRKMTPYGERFLRDVMERFAGRPVVLAGGIHYGTEITAVHLALKHHIPTIVILPSSIDQPYPLAHAKDLDKVVESGGCVLTECLPNTNARKHTFVARNHLLAAMVRYTLLVESAARGGAMTIARLSFGYGKEVMALPGNILQPYSVGCNQLIKENRAALVSSAEEVLGAMGFTRPELKKMEKSEAKDSSSRVLKDMSPEEKKIVEIIQQDPEPVSVDKLSYLMKKPVSALKLALLQLEMTRVVQHLPGNRYMLF